MKRLYNIFFASKFVSVPWKENVHTIYDFLKNITEHIKFINITMQKNIDS